MRLLYTLRCTLDITYQYPDYYGNLQHFGLGGAGYGNFQCIQAWKCYTV
jgi:hypothetical protein